jgi:hypothetical protein
VEVCPKQCPLIIISESFLHTTTTINKFQAQIKIDGNEKKLKKKVKEKTMR